MRFVFVLFLCIAAQAKADPVDWVNTYIGTGGGSDIGPDYGGTMPLVTTPFGMTNWTPQTRQNRISVSSYAYEDNTISGFIGTHQPAVWMGDYGYVTLMPQIGDLQTTVEYRQMPFSHADEVTTPYYYSVKMGADPARRIFAEMTATDHCAHMRFTFPAGRDRQCRPESHARGNRWVREGGSRQAGNRRATTPTAWMHT